MNSRRRAEQGGYPVTSGAVLIGTARALRIGGLLVGGAAAVMAVVVGCTSVTGGQAGVNARDAPAYRTSMSVSISESAASSSERESERQASLTTQAMHDTCETLSTSSAEAIDAVNAYVSAFNANSADVSATEGPAVDSLNKSADAVAGSVTDAIPDELKAAFKDWVDGAHATASAILAHAGPGEFNSTIQALNDTRSNALSLCDATY
ncbi:hypothetical protein FHT40_003032 [Mycolicibacterium sp. BK556]|uniref:hypothetical protein n=1 Tax=Mycobacteriaceae TaxID=1762 RepID=UPI00105EA049|nr:hypothetical protein [Mycobacterium sp. BK086]MBB3603371.1 hypothetical protein [Mycolicibacterium sp. BK556]MBB3633566.1 hypothetical protein [Mycolicibacterium sp. BK607]MBB3751148.1 hypothetical protein [Mycolicibacterium sp. BK634]TDO11685.1 hypothetical protein EV580_3403 [Mycobacterium sp. BK086]